MQRIGIDFDNTLVSYDRAFHTVAVQEGLIPASIAVDKLAVRNFLRDAGKEADWTALQGLVYGNNMHLAELYDGVADVLNALKAAPQCQLFIVSHKTRFPYAGTRYDLHNSARNWIDSVFVTHTQAIAHEHIFFEETKNAKVKRIAEIACDVFIDDLPEILMHPDFPAETKKILFDPLNNYLSNQDFSHRVSHWKEILQIVETHNCASPVRKNGCQEGGSKRTHTSTRC